MEGVELISRIGKIVENRNYKTQLITNISKGKRHIIIDFLEVAEADPELADEILDNFEEVHKGFQIMIESQGGANGNETGQDFKNIEVYFENIPETQKRNIGDIRSRDINKFIKIRGIIKSATKVSSRAISIRFECPSCGNIITMLQMKRKISQPSQCGCGRKGSFRILSKEVRDMQTVEIEELPESSKPLQQNLQRTHMVLEGNLVDPTFSNRIIPGNMVEITGEVVETPGFLLSEGKEDTTIKDLIITCNYIKLLQTEYEDIVISPEEEQLIKDMAGKNETFYDLSQSIAPTIYGNEKIKEALLLQAVEGCKKVRPDKTVARGMSHILLVGDPSTAKSKLGEAMKNLVPKARFAVGGSTSRSGLTAAAVRDEVTGLWSLEAGALVMASKGLFILDEADKMEKEDQASLHEAMEQGTVTKTVAGINVTLPAEASVLAIANPKMSRFDQYQPLASQIELPITILSRFDAIFPMKDIPSREKDTSIAEHILKTHKTPEKVQPKIMPDFMRKYISYARRMEPKMSDEAGEEIKRYYVELRNVSSSQEGDKVKAVPITPRQLEALIRWSEASAKLRLSPIVEISDTQRAKSIIQFYLKELAFDTESGLIDIDMITTGITSSTRTKVMLIREQVEDMSKRSTPIDIEELYRELKNNIPNRAEFEDLISKMKSAGDLFEPKRGFVSKI